ncbi:MAG: hypothetical protein A2928_03945 [Candidatus Taylorbacteria bacterium RIFCSPLOWO2_01_FULL_45_15b]|uniref:Aspartyl/glutamyl-tRNA(Asn/Gln) amidotransferase subunit C n=1 Tax=Candidatus Taylorbacteria bacterium RIFCSPLOWO2_01_FULL_45_15b TaxID=1802319 RepID=A0A1G2NGQ8_9BACT|nr:MAG: hypothetical protein A2928_03945 [Candidatus Taylorbacteria bacterium RIFCSPLOWO2_01_FULL_45_15b]
MIERKDIIKLAELSRIELSAEELEVMQKDLPSILDYVGEIQKIETVERGTDSPTGTLRRDGEPDAPGIYSEEILSAVPRRKGSHVEVKKILE